MDLKEKINNLKERLRHWEENSTKREKILLLIITIILPAFLFYKFYYLTSKEKMNLLKEDIKKVELEIAKYEGFVKREKDITLRVERRKKFLEEVKNILPTEKEIPQLLKNVSEIAKKHKLEILKFTPQAEQKRDYYDLIPFDMELKGHFYDITSFLNEIENLPRLVTLKNIEFLPQQKDEKLIIRANFNTYKYTGETLQKKQGK